MTQPQTDFDSVISCMYDKRRVSLSSEESRQKGKVRWTAVQGRKCIIFPDFQQLFPFSTNCLWWSLLVILCSPPAGLMGMPGDSSQQARTACSYQHSPGAGGSGGHHHQNNHGQALHHPHHPHHPQQHLSPHSTHGQHQAHSPHGQHQQHPAHSLQHPGLSHQSHTGQTCPSTGENWVREHVPSSVCRS